MIGEASGGRGHAMNPDLPQRVRSLLDRHPLVRIRPRAGGGFDVHGEPRAAPGHRVAGPAGEEGFFAEWSWDGAHCRVVNDRFGFQPLFYCTADGALRLSTSIVRLVEDGAPVDLDPEALAVFFRAGFFIGNATPFRHIRQLPAGAELRWDGRLDLRAAPPMPPKAAARSRAEVVDACIELFREAIRRRLPEGRPVALTLSGGRDSRHILLELRRQGCPPAVAVTVEGFPPKADECPTAAVFAAAAGVRHECLPAGSRFEAELARNLLLHFCTDEHAWAVPMAWRLPELGQVNYDGLAGGILTAGSQLKPRYVDAWLRGRPEEIAGHLLRHQRAGIEEVLTTGWTSPEAAEGARAAMTGRLRDFTDWANPLSAFFFWNRTRREVALIPASLYVGLDACYCPYLDSALFDLFMSQPAEYILDHQLHNDVLRKAYPDLASVPFLPKARRPVFRHHLRLARQMAGYAKRGDPAWWRRHGGRILAGWVPWFSAPTRWRRQHSWLHPAQLLYAVQLQVLCRTRSAEATLEPGLAL